MSTIIFNGNLTGSNFGLVFADAEETPGINVSSNPTFQVSVSINGGDSVTYTNNNFDVVNTFSGSAQISVTGGWKNSATSEPVLSLPKQAVTRYADNYFLNSSKTIDLSTDSKDLVFKFSGDHVGLRGSDTIKLVKGTNYTLTGHDSVGFTFDGLKTGASFSSGTLSAGSTTGKAKYTYSDGEQTRSGSVQIVDALDSSAPSDLSSLLTQRHVVDASAYNGGYFNKFCTSITVGDGFALHGVGDFAGYESLEQLNNASGTTLTFSGELDHAFLGCKALSTSTVLSNLDLSNVTKLVGFMSGCKNYTQYESIKIKAMTTDLTGAFEFSNYNARMKWYTQNVVSMESLFEGTPFNQGKIRSLNTAKVVSFKNMFKNAKNFNQGLKRGFSTGSATTLEGMFQGAESFNKNVSAKPGSNVGWDVSKVTNFKNVFKSSGFKKRLTGWNTSSATDMSGMLAGTDFNGKLNHLNTSKVTDMTGMFEGSRFNRPIKTWDVSVLERAERMFAESLGFNKSINDWNIGKVSTFEGMFEGAGAFDRGLNSWGNKFGSGQADNPAVNFKGMFEGSKFNQNVKDWDMSHATSVENMFKDNTVFNKPLFDASKLDSNKLDSLDGLLDGATAFATAVADPNAPTELTNSINNFGSGLENIDGFGTFLGSIASDIPHEIKSEQYVYASQGSSGHVFANKAELNTAVNAWISDQTSAEGTYGEIGTWDVTAITDMEGLFAFKLTPAAGPREIDLSNWDVSNVTRMPDMFKMTGCFSSINLSGWDVSSCTSFYSMFDAGHNSANNLMTSNHKTTLKSINLSNWTFPQTGQLYMSYMFWGLEYLETLDISGWTNFKVYYYRSLFHSVGKRSASPPSIDITNWDTSNATGFKEWFAYANFSSIGDLSNLDVSGVSNMDLMFYSFQGASPGDLSQWCVSHITSEPNQFSRWTTIPLSNLPNWGAAC